MHVALRVKSVARGLLDSFIVDVSFPLGDERDTEMEDEVESWELAIIILVALLVGAFLPLIGLIFSTIKSMKKQIADTGARLQAVLEKSETIADRVEVASRGLKGSEEMIASTMRSLSEIAASLERLKGSVKIAAAVGSATIPAVTAFINGLQSNHRKEPETRYIPKESSSHRVEQDETRRNLGSRGNGSDRGRQHDGLREQAS